MHEAVLPQTAREMLRAGEWIVPLSGGRPWLENPPLPQWWTIAVARIVGRCDAEWIVRIPPALAATATVLLTAATAARLLGRFGGLAAGYILATSVQFVRYAWLAEDEIFLAAMVALVMWGFVRIEYGAGETSATDRRFFGNRDGWTWLFFAFLGATNLVKSPLFGAAIAGAGIGPYLLARAEPASIRRYLWFWGAALFLTLGAAWPIAASLRCPDLFDLWWFDIAGRVQGWYVAINQPAWYYAAALPWVLLPWTPLAAIGIYRSASIAWRNREAAERFLLCWAIAPVAALSLASGKHHHYLLSCMAPWAMLAAIGLRPVLASLARRVDGFDRWRFFRNWEIAAAAACGALVFSKLPGKVPLAIALAGSFTLGGAGVAWLVAARRWRLLAAHSLLGLAVVYAIGHVYAGRYFDQCIEDDRFLAQVRRDFCSTPLYVHEGVEALDMFRLLFHLPEGTGYLHDLSFLRDERITARRVRVLTKLGEEARLCAYGPAKVLRQSLHSRRERSAADRLALFDVELRPDLERVDLTGVRISAMQAMRRAPGPSFGDPPVSESIASSEAEPSEIAPSPASGPLVPAGN